MKKVTMSSSLRPDDDHHFVAAVGMALLSIVRMLIEQA